MKNQHEDKRGCSRGNRVNKETPEDKCGDRHSKMTPEELGTQQSKCATQRPSWSNFWNKLQKEIRENIERNPTTYEH